MPRERSGEVGKNIVFQISGCDMNLRRGVGRSLRCMQKQHVQIRLAVNVHSFSPAPRRAGINKSIMAVERVQSEKCVESEPDVGCASLESRVRT